MEQELKVDGGTGTERWPRVTAVVPTVDRPDMLRRAVTAILEQDYPGEVECIVVFDRTEPVLPVLDLKPGRTLVAARNTRTPGLAGTRNSGYLLASGELLSSCDDDDEWLPGKLEAQVRALQETPGSAMCVTGILIHHQGQDMSRSGSPRALELADLLRERHIEAHPSSFLITKDAVLGDVGLVDEVLPGGYGEDYEWLLRAARRGSIASVTEPFVRVYWHDASFFVSKWHTIKEALAYLLQQVPEFSSEPAGLARIEGQMAFAHAALGERTDAVRLALRSLRRSRKVRQSYAALLVASRMVTSDRVVSTARRFGHGI